jgi:DeoR/GlpR family transcriptional regulator of sugar metabolism
VSASSIDRPAFGEERRQQILERVQAEGRVRVRDLAESIGVTEATIRKDIADLDRTRMLRRTHGGAIAVRPSYEPDISERVDRNSQAKRAIARACLEEIADGDAIYLDSGTTTAAIARLLADPGAPLEGVRLPRNVNLLTNAIDVATQLASVASVRHSVIGGSFRPLGGCFVGPLAISSLEQFTFNTAFIGVSGIDASGATVADLGEAQVKNTAMNQARRVIVPMDHTKIGVSDFVRVCDLDRIDMIITDEDNANLRRICEGRQVTIKVA